MYKKLGKGGKSQGAYQLNNRTYTETFTGGHTSRGRK